MLDNILGFLWISLSFIIPICGVYKLGRFCKAPRWLAMTISLLALRYTWLLTLWLLAGLISTILGG